MLLSAAATPPSAITVCALPRSDLQTTPTEQPASRAAITARSPAPPAPTTSTSYSKVSYGSMLSLVSARGSWLLVTHSSVRPVRRVRLTSYQQPPTELKPRSRLEFP